MGYKDNRHYVILDWGNNHIVARFSNEIDAIDHMCTKKYYDTWVLYQEVMVFKGKNEQTS